MSGEQGARFPERVADVLRGAGWFPGRSVEDLVIRWAETLDSPGGFEGFTAARAALKEFGGLKVEQHGPGVDHARAPFEIDPTCALSEEELFDYWAKLLGSRLYPLGEAGPVGEYLAIDEKGRVFLLTDELLVVGGTIDEALEHLIRGVRMDPLEL